MNVYKVKRNREGHPHSTARIIEEIHVQALDLEGAVEIAGDLQTKTRLTYFGETESTILKYKVVSIKFVCTLDN